jgi:hypothetical protein
MPVKDPLPGSIELLGKVLARLRPERLPLLIAIDGVDGLGKSSLASWLAWQIGAPSIHLDLYLIQDSDPLRWRSDDLARVISARLDRKRPVVVEGIMILEALQSIGRSADFLAYLEGEGGLSLADRLAAYRARCQPEQRADVRMPGFVG